MTPQQRETIKREIKRKRKLINREFYNYKANINQPWGTVFEKTLERFKWTDKGALIEEKFIHRKSKLEICYELSISDSCYDKWAQEICDIGIKWAEELKII